MRNIYCGEYEIVSRRKVKLSDGKYGWTGILRARGEMDQTVIGRGGGCNARFTGIPFSYKTGQPGSSAERSYGKRLRVRDLGSLSGESCRDKAGKFVPMPWCTHRLPR